MLDPKRRLPRLLPCLVVALPLVAPGLSAQPAGGMLFSYQPHPGQRTSFDAGYRAHLDWHREKGDSLSWYGWDVIAGGRMGQFVDGTFGISFEALDRRVDPAGDAAHASRSFADHAVATGRWAVRLRPELSTTTPLETGSPAPLVQVVTYSLPPGHQARFEDVLGRVQEDATADGLLAYTVYESIVGASDAELMVLVWRTGMASFDRVERDPVTAIRRALSRELGAALRAESELWRLRRDLTLVPARDEGSDERGEPEGPEASEERGTPQEPGSPGPAAWSTVTPGGETSCGFDDPFEFWVREGPHPTELLLYLQGGGACWTHRTCHPDLGLQFDAAITAADHEQRRDGMFDASNPDNPFRRATVVFIPYCTGDFHLGARRVTYEVPQGSDLGPVTVNHVGYRNVTAVLDHLAARPVAPSRITVVGASAGAVASPVVAARVAERFPEAVVRQIGDGAAGLRFPGSRRLLRHWGADGALAAGGYVLPDSGDAFIALYRLAAAEQPRIRFSQVATASDARVAEGLRMVGEDPGSVARKVEETYAELAEAGICFSGYVLPGRKHTIVWRPDFFSARVDGIPLARRLKQEVLDRPCPA